MYEMKWADKKVKMWSLKLSVSLVLENMDGDLILAVKGGIVKFNLENENMKWLIQMDHHFTNMRCNDGNCDIHGRLWIGEMELAQKPSSGAVYKLNNDLQLIKVIEGVTIPNGLVWSLSNDTMYFIDSPARKVNAYFYNITLGEIEFEKEVIILPSNMGVPDGMSIDEEGMLWIASYGGSCISRWNPLDGTLLKTVEIPVPHVTNCCFAGEHLDQMIVTTARENLSAADLKKYPESGDVFLIGDVGVKGVKNNLCKF